MNLSAKKSNLERKLAELEKELRNIENSTAYKREKAIKIDLQRLMKKHLCTKTEVIKILQSSAKRDASAFNRKTKSKRAPKKLKVFKNPQTGEVVETRGGNHNTLKAWKREYNLTDINKWLIDTRD